MTAGGVRRSGYRLGLGGSVLGMVAGIVQWAFGSEIPDWTGNKLHPVQLGIITIVLSALALAATRYAARDERISPARRVVAPLAILAVAGICFTTVGRLWYVPGPLLILAAAALAQAP
jgi:hypothetical protein